MNSVYGSAIVTYDRWWTVEVTGRNDYSSTLPKENSSYFYPSINTSIVLSDRFPSITHNPVLSSLKLRAGYAKVGSCLLNYMAQDIVRDWPSWLQIDFLERHDLDEEQCQV